MMFGSIVVPLDGSSLSTRVLPYVPLLAAPGAAVTFVSTIAPHHALVPFGHARRIEETALLRDLLQRNLDFLAQPLRMAGHVVETTIAVGDAVTEILACARSRGADLIAMSTHGRSGFTGLAVESVTSRVLHRTTCQTFVYHLMGRQAANTAIRTIVIPLDGSPFAARALPVAAELARRHHATIVVVEVVQDEIPVYTSLNDPPVLNSMMWESVIREDRKQAGEYVDTTVQRLRAAGLPAIGVVREGISADELVAFVARQPDPLIVRAWHARTGLTRLMLGSVVEQVLTRVSCPILVLPPAAQEAASDSAYAASHPEAAHP